MTLKTLVTGVVTGTAAAAVVGGAAAGVTSVAPALEATAPAAVQLVVWDIPMPQAPAPELEGSLVTTLNGLASGGSFRGAKEAYIEGGIGRIEGVTADRAYTNAAAKGTFPLSFALGPIDRVGATATTNVTATAATGASASQLVTFVQNPVSPTGWQISKQSALALLSSVG